MSLQFLTDKTKVHGKAYDKPEEILNDPYLSASQKYMVLEAMLAELRCDVASKRQFRISQEIFKAQSNLKKQMD